jgi:membrane-associated phospholipid phosphatase
MFKRLKIIYKRTIASVMLFTAETLLTVVLFLTSLIVFLSIAKYVFLDEKADFDEAAFVVLESFIADEVTNAMEFLGVVGNYQVMIVSNLLLICYFLFVKKHRWYSIKVPAISLSSLLLMSILKTLFNRPRPLLPLMEPAKGLSFPSGHAMMSVTFFGLLIYLLYQEKLHPVVKAIGITLLTMFIISIGISRIYLRVHYASDVLAGLCMGIIWLTIAIYMLNKIEAYSKKAINPVIERSPEIV